MKDMLAAERYAQALFELVKATGDDADVEAQLVAFAAALKKDANLEEFFLNPSYSVEQKRQTIEKLYPKNETLVRFFTVLLERNRFILIHEVAGCFKKIADRFQNEGTVQIQTAVPLSGASETAIVSKIQKLAGFKVTVKKEVDPKLIGGVVVRFYNKVLDGSVKNKIDNLRKELTKIKVA